MFKLTNTEGVEYDADLSEVIRQAAPGDTPAQVGLLCDALQQVIYAVSNPSMLTRMIQDAMTAAAATWETEKVSTPLAVSIATPTELQPLPAA